MVPPEASLGPLADGATAVVIGGGPAGVATALALKQTAAAVGRGVRVVIVEGKQLVLGLHHNLCAGVLSPPTAALLESCLGLPFPRHLARASVSAYVLHGRRHAVELAGADEPSIALRRGQFDAYMLQAALDRGIEVELARATDLEFHADGVRIYTESGPLRASVVVGAFGLDAGTAAIFARAVGYRPPPSLTSVVTKYHPGDSGMALFGERIHAFLPGLPGVEFGAVVPKGNHLTITVAAASATARHMDAFLGLPAVRGVLPCLQNAGRLDPGDLRYFKGHFPRGLAQGIAGDRFVVVGDAAGLVRAFKGKGVTSAIQTGLRAASVIMHVGVSERAFRAFHAANHEILADLPYGRAMRHLTIIAARLGLLDPVLRAAEHDPGLRQALFDAVSAHRPYGQVLRQSLSVPALSAVWRSFLGFPRRPGGNGREFDRQ
jgi:flavin-dependent dehydrogenase